MLGGVLVMQSGHDVVACRIRAVDLRASVSKNSSRLRNTRGVRGSRLDQGAAQQRTRQGEA